MKILRFTFVAGLLLLNAANGQNTSVIDQLREASKITNDSIRLHKYDLILENNGIKEKSLKVNKEPVGKTDSKWMVSTDINPIDDSKQIIFSLIADEGKSDMRRPIIFMIRYSSNKTEIYVGWSDYLGSKAHVTMRIGKEQAETSKWGMSTDNKATFYPKNCISLIKKITQVDQVVLRCTPYNESPITAVFDVRGLSEIAEEYMDDLKWW